MAVMLIESTDPQLSFHLKKNPATGLVAKRMRQGALAGWYPHNDPQKYALLFRDDTDNSSFSNDGKNFTDMTRYTSTYFVFHSISTMFSSVLKLDGSQGVFKHTITIPTVQMRAEKTITHLNKFLNLDLTVVKKSEGIDSLALYTVTVELEGTFNEFMMRTYVLFYLLHADLFQSDLGYMEGMIEKVTGILVELKAEYFLWYLFNKNIICRGSTFQKLQPTLGNGSVDGTIELQFGGTQQQRKAFVDSHMDFTNDVLDIGCGEGYYLLPYAKKLGKDKTITGIDKDARLIDSITRKVEDRKQEDKVKLHASLEDYLATHSNETEKDIICVEVIEHMPEQEAFNLLREALMKVRFRKAIISTPNRDFNQFYKTMVGFRHDDHHFEFNTAEFEKFIQSVVDSIWMEDEPYHWNIEYYPVGDTVNGIPMAQAVVITNMMEE